jgi:putative alpha-1,2-mannosidase
VDPTSLAWELIAPTFSRVTVRLDAPYPARQFTITTNNGAGGLFIHAVSVNGRPRLQNWISFDSIRHGSTVRFTLQPRPDKAWGSRPEDQPPSLSRP